MFFVAASTVLNFEFLGGRPLPFFFFGASCILEEVCILVKEPHRHQSRFLSSCIHGKVNEIRLGKSHKKYTLLVKFQVQFLQIGQDL